MTEDAIMQPVPFGPDMLWAMRQDDGRVVVAVKPICDALGMAWNGQLERIKRDTILSEGMRVIRIPSLGGPQETVCLPLELVNGWLFGIDANRVKPAVQETVLRYQRECYRVLFLHFQEQAQTQNRTADTATAPVRLVDRQIGDVVKLIDQTRRLKGKAAAVALWDSLGLGVKPGPGGQAVPTIVGRDYDSPAVAHAFAELRRPGVAPLEEAAAYRQLVDLGWRTFDIAAAVGRSHRYVQKRLLLLRLSAEMKEAVAKGWLHISIALALGLLPEADQAVGLQHHFRGEIGWRTAQDIRLRASRLTRRQTRINAA